MKKIIIGLFIFFGIIGNSFALNTGSYGDFYYDDTAQTIKYKTGPDYSVVNNLDSFIGFYRTASIKEQLVFVDNTGFADLWQFDPTSGVRTGDFSLGTQTDYISYYRTSDNAGCLYSATAGGSQVFELNTQVFIANTCPNLGYTELLTGGATVDYVLYLGPPVLELVASGSIVETQDGVVIQNLETNTDFDLDYYINDVTNNIDVIDSGNLGSFSGGLNNIDINYNFTALGDYEVGLILTDPNDPFNVIIQEYTIINFTYNEGYTEPVLEDFYFFVSGYTFFENGFSLDSFVPSPSGGKLYFDIIAPVEGGTGTVDIQTDFVLNSEIDGNGYGFDTSVIITYPYHQIAGIYQVRTVYEYDDLVVYPFGEDYNSYEITVSESPANWTIEDAELIELDFFNGIKNFYFSIKDFFNSIMQIGKVEPKTFGFLNFIIPQANAESIMNDIQFNVYDNEEGNVLSDFKDFLNGFIIFAFLLLSVILIIVINKKE